MHANDPLSPTAPEGSPDSPAYRPWIRLTDWFATATLFTWSAWTLWPEASLLDLLRAWYAGSIYVPWTPFIASLAVGIYGVFAIRAAYVDHLATKIARLASGAISALLILALPSIATFMMDLFRP